MGVVVEVSKQCTWYSTRSVPTPRKIAGEFLAWIARRKTLELREWVLSYVEVRISGIM
jgi:hypothetical protein